MKSLISLTFRRNMVTTLFESRKNNVTFKSINKKTEFNYLEVLGLKYYSNGDESDELRKKITSLKETIAELTRIMQNSEQAGNLYEEKKLEIIAKPSLATMSNIKDKYFNGIASANINFLNILINLRSSDSLVWSQCAKTLMDSVINGKYNEGLLRQIDIKETNISSFFTSLLQQFFDSKYNRIGKKLHRNISWCNDVQLKSSGYMDVCGFSYVDEKIGWIPRVVWEFSNQSGNAEAQLLAYINNLDSELQKEYAFFFLGVTLIRTSSPTICLFGYYKALDNNKIPKIATVKLFEEILSAKSLSKVLSAIDYWINIPIESFKKTENYKPLKQSMRNLCREKNSYLIYKLYDYRFDEFTLKDDRKDILFSLLYLPECKLVIDDNNIKLFQYKYIKGGHSPKSSLQVLYVLYHLQKIHNNNHVHGDIRASNIIYADNEIESQFIDFDYSGKENSKQYPSGFGMDVNDGCRHKNVSGKEFLKKEHDYFSLAYLLKSIKVTDEDKQGAEKWENICLLVSNGELAQAINILENNVNMTFQINSGVVNMPVEF